MTLFGTRKATRSPERLCCALVEYEIERLLLDDGVLLFAPNGGHPRWGVQGVTAVST